MSDDQNRMKDLQGVDVFQAEPFLDFEDESVSIQERHHAMHALTFIQFMMQVADKGRGVRLAMLERALHHLEALNSKVTTAGMKELTSTLTVTLRSQAARREEIRGMVDMEDWFQVQSPSILALAKHYGKEPVFCNLIPTV